MTTQHSPIVIRRKQVEVKTGLGRSAIYERIKAGTFPAPIALGPRAVGWIESEIDAFLNARIAERDNSKTARRLAS